MDEPGLLIVFLAGELKPEDLELDGRSQDNDGADILRLRDFFFRRTMFGDLIVTYSGIGSLTNSGRESKASAWASFR